MSDIDKAVRGAVGMLGLPHRHHRNCIHNLSPEDQITARGKTVEQWLAWGLAMPKQITREDWEVEPPEWTNLTPSGSGTSERTTP